MATVSPTWNDNQAVIAAATLARGSTTRGTLDLRADFGARLFIKIGRGGTTALTTAITVRVSALVNNGAATAGAVHPIGVPSLLSQIAAASSTTVNVDSSAGSPTLNVALITGFAAGDVICIQDSGGGVTRLEWQRISKTATGILTLDRGLSFAHTAAQADTVRNKADAFAPIRLEGGSLYEVIFDYGADTTGDTATVQALAQFYTSDTIA